MCWQDIQIARHSKIVESRRTIKVGVWSPLLELNKERFAWMPGNFTGGAMFIGTNVSEPIHQFFPYFNNSFSSIVSLPLHGAFVTGPLYAYNTTTQNVIGIIEVILPYSLIDDLLAAEKEVQRAANSVFGQKRY